MNRPCFPCLICYSYLQKGQGDTQVGWYSALTGGRGNATGPAESLNLRNGMFLGNRYESTAAASDASDPPAEKYEYQAEVQFLGQ